MIKVQSDGLYFGLIKHDLLNIDQQTNALMRCTLRWEDETYQQQKWKMVFRKLLNHLIALSLESNYQIAQAKQG